MTVYLVWDIDLDMNILVDVVGTLKEACQHIDVPNWSIVIEAADVGRFAETRHVIENPLAVLAKEENT